MDFHSFRRPLYVFSSVPAPSAPILHVCSGGSAPSAQILHIFLSVSAPSASILHVSSEPIAAPSAKHGMGAVSHGRPQI